MSLYDDLADVVVRPKKKPDVEVSIVPASVSLSTQKKGVEPTVKLEKVPTEAPDLYDNFSTVRINPQFQSPTTKLSLHHIIQQTDKARDDRFHRQKAGSGSYGQSNTVYVGNLRWWVTDQDLWNLFSQFGVIGSLKIHADKVNGKSKGYGYIQFEQSHPMAAAHAREKLNGYHLEDNGELRVEFTSKDKIKQQEFANSTTYFNQKGNARYNGIRPNTNKRGRGNRGGLGGARGSYPRNTVGRTKFKEVMCKNLVVDGHCRFGAACTYKHAPDDTGQSAPINTHPQGGMLGYVDPTQLQSPNGRKRMRQNNYEPY